MFCSRQFMRAMNSAQESRDRMVGDLTPRFPIAAVTEAERIVSDPAAGCGKRASFSPVDGFLLNGSCLPVVDASSALASRASCSLCCTQLCGRQFRSSLINHPMILIGKLDNTFEVH